MTTPTGLTLLAIKRAKARQFDRFTCGNGPHDAVEHGINRFCRLFLRQFRLHRYPVD